MRKKSIGGMKKEIPAFTTEAKERGFWSRADSTEYIDWSQAKRPKFPNLRPSLRDGFAAAARVDN